MDEDGYDSEKYEKEMEIINNMFPDAKFSICIDLEDMEEVLSKEKEIVLKNTYCCFCYKSDFNPLSMNTTGLSKRPNDYFVIKGDNLTYKYVIQELISQGFDPRCDHSFLEGFQQTSDVQFDICLGS